MASIFKWLNTFEGCMVTNTEAEALGVDKVVDVVIVNEKHGL